jgi:DNA topoisomerase I
MAQTGKRRKKPTLELITDPIEVAKAASLRYVNDNEPGIARQRIGDDFGYIGPDGKTIRDVETLERIKHLAIPPAYTDVWICADPDGHIQATGRDARGRKQYRYHPRWAEVRGQTKFDRMILFGEALPKIRARVDQDLSLRGLPREKVLAAVVSIMDTTFIRIGNMEYARDNDSYGLTTMHDEHVEVSGATIHFEFRGKSGKDHAIDLKDKRLAKIVKRSQDIPGQALFQYTDDTGGHHAITSSDVNNYLREITGESFTAKDFRTWGGTTLAIVALATCAAYETQSEYKKNVAQMYKAVSGTLGNTVAVCKKYYVHPAVIEAYQDGTLLSLFEQQADKNGKDDMQRAEAAVMALLRERLLQATTTLSVADS